MKIWSGQPLTRRNAGFSDPAPFNPTPSVWAGRTALMSMVVAVSMASVLAGCAATPDSRIGERAAETDAMETQGNSLLSMADAMAAAGDHAAAIPVYRRAHARDSASPRPLTGLGRSLMALGQVTDARRAFDSALERDAGNADANAGLGNALLTMDRAPAAIPHFQDALATNPAHADALRGLALAFDMTGDNTAARRIYNRALNTHPDDLRLRNNYGLSLALAGDTEEGVRILEEVLRDDRAGPAQRQNLALAYMLAGNERDATRIIAIDQDTRSIDTAMEYFRTIVLLPRADRLSALVAGSVPPKHDTDRPANRGHNADAETRVLTAQRIVGVEEEEPLPEPEPEPMPEPEPEPEPHRDADLSDIPLMAPGEGWSLQIAAYRRASELVEGWDILREQYHDIIGDLEPRRTEIDFGDRTESPNGFFYRLNAGPLTTLEEANERCARMRELDADCWVRPPEVDENTEPTHNLAP